MTKKELQALIISQREEQQTAKKKPAEKKPAEKRGLLSAEIKRATAADQLQPDRTRTRESVNLDRTLIRQARELARGHQNESEILAAVQELQQAQRLRTYKRATGDKRARAETVVEKRAEARRRLDQALTGADNFETMPESEPTPLDQMTQKPDFSESEPTPEKRALLFNAREALKRSEGAQARIKTSARIDRFTSTGRRTRGSINADKLLIESVQTILDRDYSTMSRPLPSDINKRTPEQNNYARLRGALGRLKSSQKLLRGSRQTAEELQADRKISRDQLSVALQELSSLSRDIIAPLIQEQFSPPREQLTETARETTQSADNFETMPEVEKGIIPDSFKSNTPSFEGMTEASVTRRSRSYRLKSLKTVKLRRDGTISEFKSDDGHADDPTRNARWWISANLPRTLHRLTDKRLREILEQAQAKRLTLDQVRQQVMEETAQLMRDKAPFEPDTLTKKIQDIYDSELVDSVEEVDNLVDRVKPRQFEGGIRTFVGTERAADFRSYSWRSPILEVLEAQALKNVSNMSDFRSKQSELERQARDIIREGIVRFAQASVTSQVSLSLGQVDKKITELREPVSKTGVEHLEKYTEFVEDPNLYTQKIQTVREGVTPIRAEYNQERLQLAQSLFEQGNAKLRRLIPKTVEEAFELANPSIKSRVEGSRLEKEMALLFNRVYDEVFEEVKNQTLELPERVKTASDSPEKYTPPQRAIDMVTEIRDLASVQSQQFREESIRRRHRHKQRKRNDPMFSLPSKGALERAFNPVNKLKDSLHTYIDHQERQILGDLWRMSFDTGSRKKREEALMRQIQKMIMSDAAPDDIKTVIEQGTSDMAGFRIMDTLQKEIRDLKQGRKRKSTSRHDRLPLTLNMTGNTMSQDGQPREVEKEAKRYRSLKHLASESASLKSKYAARMRAFLDTAVGELKSGIESIEPFSTTPLEQRLREHQRELSAKDQMLSKLSSRFGDDYRELLESYREAQKADLPAQLENIQTLYDADIQANQQIKQTQTRIQTVEGVNEARLRTIQRLIEKFKKSSYPTKTSKQIIQYRIEVLEDLASEIARDATKTDEIIGPRLAKSRRSSPLTFQLPPRKNRARSGLYTALVGV